MPPQGSLARRVILVVIVGELALAAVLSTTAGIFSLLSVARERAETLEEVSRIVAASLMPLVADQREEYFAAQLASVLDTANVRSVVAITIEDPSGQVLATSGDSNPGNPPAGVGGLLWNPAVMRQSVQVDGLTVAYVEVLFGPMSAWEILRAPVLGSVLLLVAFLVVSVPWTVWRLTVELVQPLERLQDSLPALIGGEVPETAPVQASTELRAFEDALRQMTLQLEERDARLRASYDELAAAYEMLEHAKHHIEGIAAVSAHEIRTPLTLIRLQVEQLSSGEVGELGPDQRRMLLTMRSATDRLTRLVSDLMDAALLERGSMRLDYVDVWIDEIIEDAVEDARLVGADRGLVLEASAMGDLAIMGDPIRLRQVIDNLISNAMKNSPVGGRVSVIGVAEPANVRIDVIDRGQGIDEQGEGRLFTMFGRLDHTDSRATEGLGLGLAISRRIVEAHRGTIEYSANPEGEGAVFTVRLPLDDGSER